MNRPVNALRIPHTHSEKISYEGPLNISYDWSVEIAYILVQIHNISLWQFWKNVYRIELKKELDKRAMI